MRHDVIRVDGFFWHLRDGPKESRMKTKNITSWIRTWTTQLSTMAMAATPACYFDDFTFSCEQMKSNMSAGSQFSCGGIV